MKRLGKAASQADQCCCFPFADGVATGGAPSAHPKKEVFRVAGTENCAVVQITARTGAESPGAQTVSRPGSAHG